MLITSAITDPKRPRLAGAAPSVTNGGKAIPAMKCVLQALHCPDSVSSRTVVAVQCTNASAAQVLRAHNSRYSVLTIPGTLCSQFQVLRAHHSRYSVLTIPGTPCSQFQVLRAHNSRYSVLIITGTPYLCHKVYSMSPSKDSKQKETSEILIIIIITHVLIHIQAARTCLVVGTHMASAGSNV